MGLPMAVNLTKAGFEVIGYDAFEGSREKGRAAGTLDPDTMDELGRRVAEHGDATLIAAAVSGGAQYNLPEDELLNLFKVSTGDSWVVRNWDSVSEWTADTALAVLLKDLKAAHLKGLEHNLPMPFIALSSTQLFSSMGQEKPEARR